MIRLFKSKGFSLWGKSMKMNIFYSVTKGVHYIPNIPLRKYSLISMKMMIFLNIGQTFCHWISLWTSRKMKEIATKIIFSRWWPIIIPNNFPHNFDKNRHKRNPISLLEISLRETSKQRSFWKIVNIFKNLTSLFKAVITKL